MIGREKKDRKVTQRDAGVREDSEERGTRNEIHSACAWKLLTRLLDQVDCPLESPSPTPFPPSPLVRSTAIGTPMQRGRASGRRLIRINAVAHHSRVSFFYGYRKHDIEQKLAFNQIGQWSVFFFTNEEIKFRE